MFLLDSWLAQGTCLPIFYSKDLKCCVITSVGTLICYHWLCEAEDKVWHTGGLREEEKSLWKKFGSKSFNHMSSCDAWHMRPFQLWSNHLILLLDGVSWRQEEHCFDLQACSQCRHGLSFEPLQRTGLTPSTHPWFYFNHFPPIMLSSPHLRFSRKSQFSTFISTFSVLKGFLVTNLQQQYL